MRATSSTFVTEPASGPALDRTAPAPPGARAARRARPWRGLVLSCLALAGLSLLMPSAPTYDPWAWIIWGRDIAHLDLVTTGGPSWKPLPVLFTTPFSLLGDTWAPLAWLVVARAGGLLAIALAYRLASRLAGPFAGIIAAGSLVLADLFVRNFQRGNSEGLFAALGLWAVERHLDGRRRDAFLLIAAAGLLRPEVWAFVGLYGAWLIVADWRRGHALPRGDLALVAITGIAMIVLWFLPEYLGSGDWLRAASRARLANPDSAVYADFPFLEVLRRSQVVLPTMTNLGAGLGVLVALVRWRGQQRGRIALALAATVVVLLLAVATMTQAGFAGNLRYLALPAAFVCVLAGVGLTEAVRLLRRRAGLLPAALLALVLAALAVPSAHRHEQAVGSQWRLTRDEDDLYATQLRDVVAKAGGAAALTRCGPVYTGPFQTQVVAWYLHLHGNGVAIFPFPPGTTVVPRPLALARDPRFPERVSDERWVVGASRGCRLGAAGARG